MKRQRQLLFSLTKEDFDVKFYTAGGPGGSGKDTSNTACQITHRETGATVRCQEHRSQLQNKKAAFQRLAEKLKPWLRINAAEKLGAIITAEEYVKRAMASENLKIEVKQDGKWVPEP